MMIFPNKADEIQQDIATFYEIKSSAATYAES